MSDTPSRRTALLFKVPLYPVVPVVSVAACLYLIYGLPWHTFALFAGWLALALVAYFLYGVKHSRLAALTAAQSELRAGPSRSRP